jgi:NAD-dependent DNA ligase
MDLFESNVKKIKDAADAYYDGHPTMSDADYDALVEETEKLKSIPRDIIMGKSGDVLLPYKMFSLNKVKSSKELIEKQCVVMAKIDGASALVTMQKGVITIYRRGNGIKSSTVNNGLDKVVSNNGSIKFEGMYIRGEVVLKKGVGYRGNSNALVNKKEQLSDFEFESAHFIAYEILAIDNKTVSLKISEQLKMLILLGFETPEFMIKTVDMDPSDLLTQFRDKSKYDIDGIVYFDDVEYQRSETGNPTYAVAYKGNEHIKRHLVTVTNVEWNVGTTGIIFPRVHYTSFVENGSVFNYASGKSYNFISSNNIGVGTKLNIKISGGVIPDIDSVVESTVSMLPDIEGTIVGKNMIVKTIDKLTILKGFFKRLNIDKLGDATVEKMYKYGYDTPGKILNISARDIQICIGGKILHETLYQSLSNTKFTHAELAYASCLFNKFGEARFASILKIYPTALSDPNFIDNTKLQSIHGFDGLLYTFSEALPAYHDFIATNELQNHISESHIEPTIVNSSIAVATGFTFTAEQKKLLASKGIIVKDVITLDTKYVVYKTDTNSSKLKIAKERNIAIHYDDFSVMYLSIG